MKYPCINYVQTVMINHMGITSVSLDSLYNPNNLNR